MDNQTIAELNLRGNLISDDGCRAIASILSSKSSLKLIDLRENNISHRGIKLLADSLERSPRVRRVHVHPGGRIEAYGTNEESSDKQQGLTICIVDVRENCKIEESKTLLIEEDSKAKSKRLKNSSRGEDSSKLNS